MKYVNSNSCHESFIHFYIHWQMGQKMYFKRGLD